MKKNDLIQELAATTGLSISDATKAVEGTFKIIKATLAKGHAITIRGFATICVESRKPHTGYSFSTGKAIAIPSRNKAVLKPSKELFSLLNPQKGGVQ